MITFWRTTWEAESNQCVSNLELLSATTSGFRFRLSDLQDYHMEFHSATGVTQRRKNTRFGSIANTFNHIFSFALSRQDEENPESTCINDSRNTWARKKSH
mmetsp:Transcript_41837/g.71574  ORF Transcript_41837/g.71574 Transcript_41837/m.71574 type:complete len:101 (+) Transcript_41837:2063-2365(+)